MNAALFDLGNTLLDYERSIPARNRAERSALRRLGIDITFNRFMFEKRKLLMTGYYTASDDPTRFWTDFIKPFGEKRSTKEINDLIEKSYSQWKSSFFRSWRLYPEVIPVLSRLKARGLKLGLVANVVAEARSRFIDRYGLSKYLEAIVISEEVGLSKPDPRIFRRALRMLDARPTETIFIGDRLDTDIRPAKSLGMKTIRVLRGEYRYQQPTSSAEKPDYIVRNLQRIFMLRPPLL